MKDKKLPNEFFRIKGNTWNSFLTIAVLDGLDKIYLVVLICSNLLCRQTIEAAYLHIKMG